MSLVDKSTILAFFGALSEFQRFTLINKLNKESVSVSSFYKRQKAIDSLFELIESNSGLCFEVGFKGNSILIVDPDFFVVIELLASVEISDLIEKVKNELTLSQKGPVIGDMVYFNNKFIGRVGVILDDRFQLSNGDYYINENGNASLSCGSLERSILFKECLLLKRGVELGGFWFWDDKKLRGPGASLKGHFPVISWEISGLDEKYLQKLGIEL